MLQASKAPGEGSVLAGERASASDGACSLLECCLASTSPLTSHPTTKSQSDYTPAVSGFLGLVFFCCDSYSDCSLLPFFERLGLSSVSFPTYTQLFFFFFFLFLAFR
jgi:hypothetical protein